MIPGIAGVTSGRVDSFLQQRAEATVLDSDRPMSRKSTVRRKGGRRMQNFTRAMSASAGAQNPDLVREALEKLMEQEREAVEKAVDTIVKVYGPALKELENH